MPLPVHLTLVIPELIWHEPAELDARLHRTPALNRLLAWGRLTREPRLAQEIVLAKEIGDARPAPAGPISLAAARALADDVPPDAREDARWLCADPVHLRFHQDRILVADASLNPPSFEPARALVATLNDQFADTLTFFAAAPTRWYARLPRARIEALAPLPAPLSTIVGRQLPSDGFGRAPALRQLANEVQMALHAHPLNRAEADAGRAAINALWLWDAEVTATAHAPRHVAGHGPLVRGLATVLGHAPHDCPTDADTFLQQARGAAPLAWLDSLDAPARSQDRDAYGAHLSSLETAWFAPIERALRRGTVSRLTLVAPGAYGVLRWQVAPPSLWARRPWAADPPDLASRAQELAQVRPT